MLKVSTVCSNQDTGQNDNLNLTTATDVVVTITKTNEISGKEEVVCVNDNIDTVKLKLMKKVNGIRTIEFDNCLLKDGEEYNYSVVALIKNGDAISAQKSLLFIGHQSREFDTFIVGKEVKSNPRDEYFSFLAQAKVQVLANANNGESNQEECDSQASPLMIQTQSDSQLSFSLWSKSLVQFDIMGENGFKIGKSSHQAVPVSWVEQSEFMFLVKPSKASNGQLVVRGIDDMFGDNTKGPDGQFASNGFTALAKFDSNTDGYITQHDQVFGDLRLWSDINLDGKSQSNELIKLSDKKIQSIDLNYDPHYKEVDSKTGNQILFKSVVKAANDQVFVIFDLWFDLSHLTN